MGQFVARVLCSGAGEPQSWALFTANPSNRVGQPEGNDGPICGR
jgi:hypothetical protein